MVGDICDEDELRTGHRTEGSYYSIYWWFIKLGTAFASFVAGILITLTLFDETQVTRVDGLQGSVRDMQAKVTYWKGYTGKADEAGVWMKNAQSQAADALKESRDYLVYLENEIVKKPSRKNIFTADIEAQRKNVLMNATAVTRENIVALGRHGESLASAGNSVSAAVSDSLIRATVPLIMQSKMTRARISSSDLLVHLRTRSNEQQKSRAHTEHLIGSVAEMNNMIYALEPSSPLEVLEAGLAPIVGGIEPLKKQSPYTLLMMRVVEIGLPVLLCLLALAFAFRYALTEKRTLEIKELLRTKRGEAAAREGN
jgi:glycoside/pentoside/hexuronide:cation symporter, GPH family